MHTNSEPTLFSSQSQEYRDIIMDLTKSSTPLSLPSPKTVSEIKQWEDFDVLENDSLSNYIQKEKYIIAPSFLKIRENITGLHDFRIDIQNNSKTTKSMNYTFSTKLNMLFVQYNTPCMISAHVKGPIPRGAVICATPYFIDARYEDQCVTQCQNHASLNIGNHIASVHLIRSDNARAHYCDSHEGHQCVVLPCAFENEEFTFRFMCSSTCITGIFKRRFRVQFTLEQDSRVLGSCSIEVKISACPGRDQKSFENKSLGVKGPRRKYNKKPKNVVDDDPNKAQSNQPQNSETPTLNDSNYFDPNIFYMSLPLGQDTSLQGRGAFSPVAMGTVRSPMCGEDVHSFKKQRSPKKNEFASTSATDLVDEIFNIIDSQTINDAAILKDTKNYSTPTDNSCSPIFSLPEWTNIKPLLGCREATKEFSPLVRPEEAVLFTNQKKTPTKRQHTEFVSSPGKLRQPGLSRNILKMAWKAGSLEDLNHNVLQPIEQNIVVSPSKKLKQETYTKDEVMAMLTRQHSLYSRWATEIRADVTKAKMQQEHMFKCLNRKLDCLDGMMEKLWNVEADFKELSFSLPGSSPEENEVTSSGSNDNGENINS